MKPTLNASLLIRNLRGACVAVGGNIVTDAFGVVAMVAMTPLITIQLLGILSRLQIRRTRTAAGVLQPEQAFALLDDDAIIEL